MKKLLKKILIILFLYVLQMYHIQAQTTDCVSLERYKDFIAKGKKLVQEGDYVQAMQYYNSAKDNCKTQSKEVDALFTEMIAKIDKEKTEMKQALVQVQREKQKTDSALVRAEEMQRRVETSIFDKAIKEKNKEWAGYQNTNEFYRNEVLDKIDSLDLSDNALLRIPQEIKGCKNLKHLNLLGNKEIDWKSIEGIKTPSIYVTIKNLKQIDIAYWKQITGIQSYKQDYITIPDNIFEQTQLTYLHLGENKINEIPAKIGELKNLRSLYLYGNQLTTLPTTIGELKNLQNLYLSNNQLTTLPTTIGELKNLQNLYLSNNQLTTLPAEIGQLKNLEILYLSNNQLTTLPAEIGQLKNLESLNFENNQLTILPKEIGQLENLQILELKYNKLTILPKEISELKSLKGLNLSNNIDLDLKSICVAFKDYHKNITLTTNLRANQGKEFMIKIDKITTLPSEIRQLKKLQILYLAENQLTNLPKEIGELKDLKELNLDNNQIIKLPKEIGDLKNLQKLDLSKNYITILPRTIGKLKNLEILNLRDNQLTILPTTIGNLKNLKNLYLAENQFTTLPTTIGELKNLNTLNLAQNQLTTLPTEIRQLKNLEVLSLRENQFTTLPATISELKNLRRLYLFTNQLTTLPATISELKNLRLLSLNENLISEEEMDKIRKLLPDCEIKDSSINYSSSAQEHSKKRDYFRAYKDQKRALSKKETNYIDWFNLSFYALFVGKPEEAIIAAQKSLQLAPDKNSVISSLALGYVLNNQWEKAESIYNQWKDKKFNDDKRSAKDVFLKNIANLEKANIKHKDFEKAKKLLNE